MRHVFYPAVVHRDGEQRQVLKIPDLGVTEVVAANADLYLVALEAATLAIGRLRQTSQPTPVPTPLADIYGGEMAGGAEFLFQVPVATYADYVRLSMNFDQTLVRRIDAAAAEKSMSRTAFLSSAALAFLDDYSNGAESPGDAPARPPAAAIAAPSLR